MKRTRVVSGAAALLLAACDSGSAGHGAPPPLPPAHAVIGGTVSAGAFTLELIAGVSVLRVQTGDLSGYLYRVSTPTASGSYPVVRLADRTIQVSTSGAGNAALTVEVAVGTPWLVRLDAGVSTASIDLRVGGLRGLTAIAGISTLDIAGATPHGNVMLIETGGVSAFALHVPAATPVTVDVHAGAGRVSLFGTDHAGVPAGTTYSSAPGPNRYTISAHAGAGSISVDTT